MSDPARDDKGPKYARIKHETLLRLLLEAKGAPTEVYLALSTHANWYTGWCNPSWGLLEKETGLSRSSIARAMRRLEAMQLLTRKAVKGGKTEYVLSGTSLIGDTGTPTPPVPPATPPRPTGGTNPSHGRNRGSATGDTGLYNEPQGTSLKNKGEAPGSPPAASEGDLIGLSRAQKLYAGSDTQRADVVESLVALHGYEGALAILKASKGGDIHRLLKTPRAPAAACAASAGPSAKARPKCRNPACVDGQVVDPERSEPGVGGRTAFKPCPKCGGVVQTSAKAGGDQDRG